VTELKISDFKMFEKTLYEIPPPRPITEIIINGLKEIEKTYGPVFTTRFIKHALEFEAQRIGEKPPQDIKTLNDLLEYLVSKSDKYPTPYCTTVYAQYKTENEFQGKAGAGTRIGHLGAARSMSETLSVKDRKVDVDGSLLKLSQILISMNFSPREWGYKKNGDGSVDLLWPKCHYVDGCRSAFDEGLLKRPDGRLQCIAAFAVSQYLKLTSGYEWDYEVLENYKPHCIARSYML